MRLALVRRLAADRPLLLELFVATNLAFLVLDVWVAHSVNDFRHPAEWIPLFYAAAGAATLLAVLAVPGPGPFRGHGRLAGLIVGGLGIVVGASGLVFHLESQFFELRTLRSLVYSAPFVAPLAFTGLGFLLLLNRTVRRDSAEWGLWVVLLALGGFVGNFGLSLADHAQNGFFHPAEWIPVIVSAVGVGYLTVVLAARVGAGYLRLGWPVLALQALTGAVGFVLHLLPAFAATAVPWTDRIIFGPPVFAPLLFVNLALLAGLGLWDLTAKGYGRAQAAPPATEAT